MGPDGVQECVNFLKISPFLTIYHVAVERSLWLQVPNLVRSNFLNTISKWETFTDCVAVESQITLVTSAKFVAIKFSQTFSKWEVPDHC